MPADELAAQVRQCVETEYEDAVNEVPYDSGDGGYQASVLSGSELLWEIGFEAGSDAAFDFLARELSDVAWVQRDYFSLHPYNSLRYGWEGFCEAVKHRHRYLFFEPRTPHEHEQHDEIRPERMLDALSGILNEAGLVRQLEEGTALFRVRPHSPSISPSSLFELGSPPPHVVTAANRMSPAGISMLYAAEDEKTAVRETIGRRSPSSVYTVAELATTVDICIVDLVDLPAHVGVFAPDTTREERAAIDFLHSFVRDLSKPIARDRRAHIEYVPTQVVTEFLRFRFRPDGRVIQGIRFPSSRSRGGVNIALFTDHELEHSGIKGMTTAQLVRLLRHTRVP